MLDITKQNIKFLDDHPAFCVLAFTHLRVQVKDIWEGFEILGRASSLCCSAPSPVEVELNSSLNDIIQHNDFDTERKMFYANKLPSQCENVCSLNYKNPACKPEENQTKREIVNEMYIDTISYEKVFKQPDLKIIDYNFTLVKIQYTKLYSTIFIGNKLPVTLSLS